MAMQFSPRVRNAAANAIEAAIGPSPTLRIRTGPKPADTDSAATGTVLATIVLPADFFADALNGVKAILGTWQDSAADAAGIAGHFEITQPGFRDVQGSVTGTGGGGDMEIQNTNIAAGQAITVTAFNITIGGA